MVADKRKRPSKIAIYPGGSQTLDAGIEFQLQTTLNNETIIPDTHVK